MRTLVDRILAAMVAAAPKFASDRTAPDAAATEFVVVSSLAEGADRIVAEAGLAAGYKLQAVLPLDRTEYARDFETKDSRAAFERLLDRACAVIELDGAPDARPAAYEAAGLYMLANIDLLIAIWDGQVAAGVGGTAEIVDRAIADGILVAWIEPANPNTMKVSRAAVGVAPRAEANALPQQAFRSADVATLARAANEILTPRTR